MRPTPRAVRPEKPRSGREVDVILSKTVELLARARLERERRETTEARRETQRAPLGSFVQYGYPLALFPGFYTVVEPSDELPGVASASASAPSGMSELLRRPPGSLLPPGNRGRIRQPGSLIPSRGYR